MRFTGAGVIIYAVNEGKILLLLGREKFTLGWKQGSHRWSSFSGKLEKNEAPIYAAAREFLEESCCCIPIGTQIQKDIAEVVHVLQQNAEHLELTTYVRGELLVYHVYLLELDYRRYDIKFSETRQILLDLDELCKQYMSAKRSSSTVVSSVFMPGFRITTLLTVLDFALETNSIRVSMLNLENEQIFTIVYNVEPRQVQTLIKLQGAWNNLRQGISTVADTGILDHPAVNLSMFGGHLIHASVNKNYLEKCEIGWWSLDDLLMSHSNYMNYRTIDERFRKLFLTNICKIGDKIRKNVSERNIKKKRLE